MTQALHWVPDTCRGIVIGSISRGTVSELVDALCSGQSTVCIHHCRGVTTIGTGRTVVPLLLNREIVSVTY